MPCSACELELRVHEVLSPTPRRCHVLPTLAPELFHARARERLVKCGAFGISHTLYFVQASAPSPPHLPRK